MIETWFRHADRRVPFLWETVDQPSARWHGDGAGPAQYLADTPEGAWAEFLRHEGITHAADLAGVDRSLWALDVEFDAEELREPQLDESVLTGGLASYPLCQEEAGRLRDEGATALLVGSAALLPGKASGELVDGGELRDAPPRDGRVLCLFEARPNLRGHRCIDGGSVPERVLPFVRPLTP